MSEDELSEEEMREDIRNLLSWGHANDYDAIIQEARAAAEQRGAVKAWRNGYVHGIHDERLNQAHGGGNEPSRLNPYVTDQIGG